MKELKELERLILDFFLKLKNESEYLSDKRIPISAIKGLSTILKYYNFNCDEFYSRFYSEDTFIVTPKIFSDVFEKIFLRQQEMSKSTGSFYTSTKIAANLAEKILEFKDPSFKEQNNFRILDPACGGGEFLVNCANSLLQRYKFRSIQEELPNKFQKEVLLRQKIVKNCIYGIDLEPLAVFITKLRLFFWIYSPIFGSEKDKSKFLENMTVQNENGIDFNKNILAGDFLKIEYNNFTNFDNFDCEIGKFKDKRFDIIIGNPPFNVKIPIKTEKYLTKFKKRKKRPIKNSAAYFLILSRRILKKNGLLGLIMPKSLAYSRSWNSVKNFTLTGLIYLKDISKAFTGVKLEQIILIGGKGKEIQNTGKFKKYRNNYLCEPYFEKEGVESQKSYLVPKKFCTKDSPLILGIHNQEFELFKKVNEKISTKIGDFISARRGFNIQKLALSADKVGLNNSGLSYVNCFGGREIKQFGLKSAPRVIKKEKIRNYLVTERKTPLRIIGQLANAHVKNPFPHFKLAFFPLVTETPGNFSNFSTFDTIINIFPKNNVQFYYLLGFLNSNFFAWYLYKIIYSGAIRSTRLDEIYLTNVPFINLDPISGNKEGILILFKVIIKSLLLLNQMRIHFFRSKSENGEIRDINKIRVNKIKETTEKDQKYLDSFYNDLICILYLNGFSELESLTLEEHILKRLKDFNQSWNKNYEKPILTDIPMRKIKPTIFFKEKLSEIIKKMDIITSVLKNISEKELFRKMMEDIQKSAEYKIIRSPFLPKTHKTPKTSKNIYINE
ncbi:MAG: Eco57I restriction-modification methylase domain-containing protein [Promethearchaeota archaeon]